MDSWMNMQESGIITYRTGNRKAGRRGNGNPGKKEKTLDFYLIYTKLTGL